VPGRKKKDSGEGGAAVVMKEGEQLLTYSIQYIQAFSPLQTDVHAMEMAIQELNERRIVHGKIITDCKQIVDAVTTRQPPLYLDWRLYSQIVRLWMFFLMKIEGLLVYLR
jgi:ribonuclease HI